ncbi:DUF6291 domain-containing protein [Treponema pectinovorum]|uniref:DUF6291 domain-containing protein n=1 Tax=Treponema pectinovorum TaxID=164 RepID=UPI0011C9EB7D|nr:DUF6291 domain-containing protein [Treponema pectinovorum]
MRESFVFHSEYIEDLPDEYKTQYAMYAINYALKGEEPAIEKDTLEHSLWIKIARRIDSEAEKYKAISEKRREAAKKRFKKTEDVPAKNEVTQKKEESPETKEKFVKPTVEEIAEYCAQRNNKINAQSFFDFYESKGWKIGSVKMKDWKASVRTWEQRKNSEDTSGRKKSGSLWGNENEVSENYMNLI